VAITAAQSIALIKQLLSHQVGREFRSLLQSSCGRLLAPEATSHHVLQLLQHPQKVFAKQELTESMPARASATAKFVRGVYVVQGYNEAASSTCLNNQAFHALRSWKKRCC
jgi:hypothetical protein